MADKMVIGNALPGGFPGDVTRPLCNIEAWPMDTKKPVKAFGVPVKLIDGKVQPLEASDTAEKVYGLLVRTYPDQSNPAVGNSGFGLAEPDPSLPASVMIRGYMGVHVNAGTVAVGGKVYVRVGAASGSKVLGGIEAEADSTNTVELVEAFFMTGADADGNAELRLDK